MYVLYCYQISIDVYMVNECKLIYDVVYNFFNLDYVNIVFYIIVMMLVKQFNFYMYFYDLFDNYIEKCYTFKKGI